MAQSPDTARFTVSNAAFSSDRSTLKDFTEQIKFLTKALESATNNAVKVVTSIDEASGLAKATFLTSAQEAQNAREALIRASTDLSGRYAYSPDFVGSILEDRTKTFEFHRTMKGRKAQRTATEALADVGSSVELDPTHTNKDRMKIMYSVSEREYTSWLAKLGSEEAVKKMMSKNVDNILRQAKKQSVFEGEERDLKEASKEEEREKRRQEREARSNHSTLMHVWTAVLSVLGIIADITRRILTATLTNASEFKKQAVDATSVGISLEASRRYAVTEKAMGLDSGTFISALQNIQNSFGDISNLNEKAISELAKVLQGDTLQVIKSGLGQNNPQEVMRLILDEYFNRGNRGINSLGMQVGQYQAQRELATALTNAGLGELATVLRNMFYTNNTGIYAGQVTGLESYTRLVQTDTMGLTEYDYKHAAELGQVVDQLNAKFSTLKTNIEDKLLISLEGLLNLINKFNIGKSKEDTLEDIKTGINSAEDMEEALIAEQEVVKGFYQSRIASTGVNFSLMGYSDFDALMEDIIEDKYTVDKMNARQQEEFDKLSAYFATPEGLETLQAIKYSEVLANRIDLASKQRVSGKYTPSEFTAAKMQEMADDIDSVWFDKKSALPYFMYAASGRTGNAWSYFKMNEDEIIKNFRDYFFRGGDFDYDVLVKMGGIDGAGELTDALAKRANKGSSPFGWSFWFKSAKEAYVRKALEEGLISQADIEDLVTNYGLGIPYEQRELITGFMVEKGLKQFGYQAGAFNIINQALSTNQMQKFLQQKLTDGKITVSGYNPETGNVTVTIVAKNADSQEVKELVTFQTQAVLGSDFKFETSLDSIVNKSHSNGSGQ